MKSKDFAGDIFWISFMVGIKLDKLLNARPSSVGLFIWERIWAYDFEHNLI